MSSDFTLICVSVVLAIIGICCGTSSLVLNRKAAKLRVQASQKYIEASEKYKEAADGYREYGDTESAMQLDQLSETYRKLGGG